MAALVQSYPQQSGTVTMLQTRPSSASGILQSSSQTPSHHQYAPNLSHVHRNSFHGMNTAMAPQPIAPYAFTRTPALVSGPRTQSGPHLRADQRAASALGVPTYDAGASKTRSRYPAASSISTTSSSSSSDLSALSQKASSKEDPSADRAVHGTTPQLTMTTSTSTLGLSAPAASSTAKSSPDRYRRPNNRRAESSTASQQSNSLASAMPNVQHFYGSSTQQATLALTANQEATIQVPQSLKQTPAFTPTPRVTADDLHLMDHMSKGHATKYRRRSIHTIEAAGYSYDGVNLVGGLHAQGSRQLSSANGRIDQHPLRSSPVVPLHPVTSHGRNNSSESVDSTRSGHRSRPSSVSCPSNFPSARTRPTAQPPFGPQSR